MIVEFRTYSVRPRTLPEFLKRCGEHLERRLTYSKLAAFWYTEFGPLNQVIQAWSYKDDLERRQIQDQVIRPIYFPISERRGLSAAKASAPPAMIKTPPTKLHKSGTSAQKARPSTAAKMMTVWL